MRVFILAAVLLCGTSCSMLSQRVVVSPHEVQENCVERFLRLGAQPSDASNICKDIHK